jgi:osmotically-inducible protein OsmY
MIRHLSTLLIALLVAGCAATDGGTGARTSADIDTDERIESDIRERIRASDAGFRDSHVVVTSFRAVVLLAGQVPTEALRSTAQAAAKAAADVRRVHNELVVAAKGGITGRASDTWLTTKVRSALASSEAVDEDLIGVAVVDGAVYLIGTVPRAGADAAVEATQSVSGVEKIVRVFEYLD